MLNIHLKNLKVQVEIPVLKQKSSLFSVVGVSKGFEFPKTHVTDSEYPTKYQQSTQNTLATASTKAQHHGDGLFRLTCRRKDGNTIIADHSRRAPVFDVEMCRLKKSPANKVDVGQQYVPEMKKGRKNGDNRKAQNCTDSLLVATSRTLQVNRMLLGSSCLFLWKPLGC